jgi:predicted porin
MKLVISIPTIAFILFSNTASAEFKTEGDWGSGIFYGSLRLLLTHEKNRGTDIADGVSRIGVKGVVNINDSWKGVYRLEGRVVADTAKIFSDDNDFHKRLSYIGLKNKEFGESRIGKQYSPHYLWTILPIDVPFHNPRHYNVRMNANVNSSVREANSISYFSPKYNGLTFGLLAEIDGADDESSFADSYNIAAKYNNGPWQLALSFYSRHDNLRIDAAQRPGADTLAAAFQYKNNSHKVVIRYQDENIENNEQFTTLGGYYSYRFANYNGLEAQARIYNLDNGVINGNQIALGLTKTFGKAGQIFIDYTTYDDNAKVLKKGRDDDITIGYKLNF